MLGLRGGCCVPLAHPSGLTTEPWACSGHCTHHQLTGLRGHAWKAPHLCTWTQNTGAQKESAYLRETSGIWMIPNPPGLSSSLLSAQNLKDLRGVFWISLPTIRGSGWEHQEEQLCHERTGQWLNNPALTQQPGMDSSRPWVRGCCWDPWRGSGEKCPFWMILECISLGITPALSTTVWGSCTLQPMLWGRNTDCSGVSKGWGEAGESLSSLHSQQPHKMSSPRSETQLEVTQTSPAYFAFSKQRTGHQSKPIICARACHNK